ncbi:MAG: IclR family transcriptional regulator [Lautropia sp.]
MTAVPAIRARRQRVQGAATGVAVLKGLAHLGGRASLSVLAARLGESAPKLHRYLVSLIEEGLVAQDPATTQYYLGPEAIGIGLAAMSQSDPIRVAEPGLARLRDELAVTAFVAVPGNRGPTIVRMLEPGLPVTIKVCVGSVLSPLWSATGRAFLAWCDDAGLRAAAQQELAAATPAQRAGLAGRGSQAAGGDPIDRLCRQIRDQGCALVKDIYQAGISAVAVPVFDHAGRVCAVLTALGATGGFDASIGGPPAQAVRREAQAASHRLGHAVVVPMS